MTARSPREDKQFSLLRVVNFVLRYKWALGMLSLVGLLAAAGLAALAGERTYTAEAQVRVPQADSVALTSYESMFRSAEVLSALRDVDSSEASISLRPSSLRERLEVTRSGDLVEIRLAVPSERLATGGLRRAIAVADSLYLERSLQTRDRPSVDTAQLKSAWDAVAEVEQQLQSLLDRYGNVEFGSEFSVGDSLPTLAQQSTTVQEASLNFELSTLQPRLSQLRDRVRSRLLRAARGGVIAEGRARREVQAARDTVRAWLARQSPGELSASQRFEYESLLWRVDLWEKAAGATGHSERPGVEPVVVAEPTLASVASSNPVQRGIVGLLVGALLGLIWGLIREAIRRGKEQGTDAYREFRTIVSGPVAASEDET